MNKKKFFLIGFIILMVFLGFKREYESIDDYNESRKISNIFLGVFFFISLFAIALNKSKENNIIKNENKNKKELNEDEVKLEYIKKFKELLKGLHINAEENSKYIDSICNNLDLDVGDYTFGKKIKITEGFDVKENLLEKYDLIDTAINYGDYVEVLRPFFKYKNKIVIKGLLKKK